MYKRQTHKAEIRKLSASLPEGRLVITQAHELWPEAAAIAAHFGETYYGAGLPAVVGQALESAIRMKREPCTDQQRLALWKAQDGKCKLCFEELQDGQDECDHVVPLVTSCKGQAVQLRLLCGVCHASVTDSGQRRTDPLASTFNLHTWQFVTSARPVPATFTANVADTRRAPFVL